MQDLHDFLLPIDRLSLNEDNSFNDGQIGTHILTHEKQIPDISDADVVLIGINEARGSGQKNNEFSSADAVRKELYQLHYWHKTVVLADWGNVVIGRDVADSYAALKTVINAGTRSMGNIFFIMFLYRSNAASREKLTRAERRLICPSG